MRVTTELDSLRWSQSVNDYVRLLGYKAPDVLRVQTRALMSACIKLTPPFTSGGSAQNDQQAGDRSVTRNLKKAITPAQMMQWKNPRLKEAWDRIVASGDLQAGEKFLQSVKGFKAHRVMPFDASIHRKSLDSRGRAHVTRVVTFEFREWLNYLTTLLSRVGLARSGWLAGFYAAGGNTNQLGGMQWVTRHGSGRTGAVRVNLNDPNPSITVSNWAKGIRHYGNAFNRAIRLRAGSMERNVRRMLEAAAKQVGVKFGRYQTTYRRNDAGDWEITGAA